MASETSGNARSRKSYRRIDSASVHETVQRLEARIAERFPDSGLRKVAQDLVDVSRNTIPLITRIRRRSIAMRALSWLLCVPILAILLTVPFTLRPGKVDNLADAVQVLEAALSASFFIGASILFLLTLETRMRHQRTMGAIHELRSLAHVVDMHQLTKDPTMLLLGDGAATAASAASPPRTYTPFELQRYLDYCSEMLALISKVAVLYVQDSADPATIAVVDQIEDLTNGLSRKIWQKIMLIHHEVTTAQARALPSLAQGPGSTETLAPDVSAKPSGDVAHG